MAIIGGLRLGLECATGRYILPVDSDDYLYPDCFRTVTWWLRQAGFPPLLYSDEDKVIGGKRCNQPGLHIASLGSSFFASRAAR